MTRQAYNSLNSFTQGGQFLRNFMVMAKQNVIRTLVGGLLVGLVAGWISWSANADGHDRYVLLQEITLRATNWVNPKADPEVALLRSDGRRTITTSKRRMTVAHYAQDYISMRGHFLRAVIVGAVWAVLLVALLFAIAARIGFNLGRDKHVRGALLETPKQVAKRIAKHNKRQAELQNNTSLTPYKLAGLDYPFRSETQHTLACGSTGSGKTQLIFQVVQQIYERGDRGVFYDKMRSFIEAKFDTDRDFLLNPLDARCSPWDMFADARHIVDWEMIAQALIPDENTKDPFFETTARTVFAYVAARIQEEAVAEGRRPVISDLLIALTSSSDQELHDFLRGTPAERHIDPANPRTTGSIRSTVANAIRSLGFLRDPKPDETPFSIRAWVKDDDKASVVYLTSREDMHAVLQPLLTMWIGIFNSALMSQRRSSSRLIWFILDELPSLNRLPSLEQVLAEARQFGAAYLLGIQLVSQLRAIYGKDGADTILGLARTKIVFNPGDPITAETMAQFIGKQEVTRKDHSMSVGATELRDGQSVSNRVTQELIIMPEELATLASLNGILSFTGDFPACRIKIDYQSLEGDQPDFVEDPQAITRNRQAFDPSRKARQSRRDESSSSSGNDGSNKVPMGGPNSLPPPLGGQSRPVRGGAIDVSAMHIVPNQETRKSVQPPTAGNDQNSERNATEPKRASAKLDAMILNKERPKPSSTPFSEPPLPQTCGPDTDEGGMDQSIGADEMHRAKLAAEVEQSGTSPSVLKNGRDMRLSDREREAKKAEDDYYRQQEERIRRQEREADALEKEQPAYRGDDLAPEHFGGR